MNDSSFSPELSIVLHDGNGYASMTYERYHNTGSLVLNTHTHGKGDITFRMPLGHETCRALTHGLMSAFLTGDLKDEAFHEDLEVVNLRLASAQSCIVYGDIGPSAEWVFHIYETEWTSDRLNFDLKVKNLDNGTEMRFSNDFDRGHTVQLAHFFIQCALLECEGPSPKQG